MLMTAMVDFVVYSYHSFLLIDDEILRIVRQYCGPIATVGVFLQIAAVLVAGHSRWDSNELVYTFSFNC